ncbi:MAG TPA: hypothetical protein DHV48_11060 [Prolixibacteraceae bacterium]|nr:hypothetical protein [Prolixibacteraceae bacterium]
MALPIQLCGVLAFVNLGKFTKTAASLLRMGIVVGAVLPLFFLSIFLNLSNFILSAIIKVTYSSIPFYPVFCHFQIQY